MAVDLGLEDSGRGAGSRLWRLERQEADLERESRSGPMVIDPSRCPADGPPSTAQVWCSPVAGLQDPASRTQPTLLSSAAVGEVGSHPAPRLPQDRAEPSVTRVSLSSPVSLAVGTHQFPTENKYGKAVTTLKFQL